MLFVELLLGAFPDFQEAFIIERNFGDRAVHAIPDALTLPDCRWFARLVSELVANINMLGIRPFEGLVI